MRKGTPNFFLTAFSFKFQNLFHSHIRGSFQSFPHGTFRYRLIKLYLSLESGLPFFKQNFTCFVLLISFNVLRFLYNFDNCFFISFHIIMFSAFFVFATPLLTKSLLIFFPFATEMFHFAKFFFFFIRVLCSYFVFIDSL